MHCITSHHGVRPHRRTAGDGWINRASTKGSTNCRLHTNGVSDDQLEVQRDQSLFNIHAAILFQSPNTILKPVVAKKKQEFYSRSYYEIVLYMQAAESPRHSSIDSLHEYDTDLDTPDHVSFKSGHARRTVTIGMKSAFSSATSAPCL